MKSVPISAACLLFLTITCQPASSEPGLAPLAAFKAGLLAGILKGLKIQPASSSPNGGQSYQGTASGDLTFSGSLNRNGSPYNNNGYGQPYWNSGQLKLTGNVNYSGQGRPTSSNGSGTRRQSLRGNVTFNANISPIHTTTNAPAVAYALTPVESYTMAPVKVAPAPTNVATINNGQSSSSASMSNGYNVAEVHAVRSNSRMPYGYGNVNINVANAGSGIGAVVNLNGDRTRVSTSEPSSAVEVEPSTFDDLSSFSSTSDDSLVPASETYSDISTDTKSTLPDDTFGSYDSFDSVNEFDTKADNEIVPETNYDFTGTETDFGGTDFSTNSESNTDSFVSSDFASDSTTKEPNRVNIDFNASGSGSITRGNGLRGSGNLGFDSSISTSAVAEEPIRSTDSYTSDTGSFSDYDGTFSDLDSGNVASGFNRELTSDIGAGSTSDFSSDSNSNFNQEVTSDYNTDITSDFNTDTTSDYSTDFADTNVPEASDTLRTNNDFEINTSGYVSGTTNDNLEPSVAVSGTNTELYNSYIQSNVDAIRALSDIAKSHGSGRPVTIRLRTAHSVRQPSQASSTAGGGLLGIFLDGSRYKVSQGPLLYKYSDVIESTDASPPGQWQVSASASGNANLDFVEGRSITGGRMRLERRTTTQAKSIPGRSNLPSTIAENMQRAQLHTVKTSNNGATTRNRSHPRQAAGVPANHSNSGTRPNIPQRSNAPLTRASNPVQISNANTRVATNEARSGVGPRNSNRNIDAKSITDSRRTQAAANTANINNEFSFLGVLAQFAEAHRQTLIKDAQKTPRSSAPDAQANHRQRSIQMPRIPRHVSGSESSGRALNTFPIQVRPEVPVVVGPTTRTNFRGMLYESNPAATGQSSPTPPKTQNILNHLNRPIMNQGPRNLVNLNPTIQVSIGPSNRGNLGIQSLPPNPQKSPVSSLHRKENSGITRAKLRFRHFEVIPSPQP